ADDPIAAYRETGGEAFIRAVGERRRGRVLRVEETGNVLAYGRGDEDRAVAQRPGGDAHGDRGLRRGKGETRFGSDDGEVAALLPAIGRPASSPPTATSANAMVASSRPYILSHSLATATTN